MLKRVFYLCLMLICPLLLRANEQASALFEQGNAQYSKGKYQEAIASYQKIIAGGYQSETVYFNMGDAYYKLDDIPSAILYFEKARKLNPGDEDVNFNIQLANLKTTDKIDPNPQFFIARWWNGFILMFTVGTLSVFSILFFLTGFLALAAYLFAPTSELKRAAFYAGIALIFFGCTTLFMSNRQLNYLASHQQAIIFSNSVNVRSEPAMASKTLFVIHDGTKVQVTGTDNGWMKVKLPNGNEGWITISDAKQI